MDLSVIIVNWNTRGSLLECLESLRTHIGEAITHEIFVVDNGSTDDSVAQVRVLYPEVTLIENEENRGFARANNQALRVASGRFMALLNTDVRFSAGALDTLLDFMHDHPEAGMAGGQLLNRDESRQNSFSAFPSLITELCNKSLLKMLFPWWFPGKFRKFHGPTKVDSLIGACMLVRSSAVEETGLMDEVFFLFFEETDWCLRMRKAGWDIYHVPLAKIYHAQGRSVEQDKKNAVLEYFRSRYLYFNKHRPRWESLALRVGLWVKMFVNISWAAFMWVLTLGKMKEFSQRLATLMHVLKWHLARCPREIGLPHATPRTNLLEMHAGKVKLTACLITHNEEENVRECLESLGFVTDIVVIDSFSQDRTPQICREYTDKVFQTAWQGFSATKNLCVEQAETDWVLVVDADERVTPELRAEIMDLKEDADGFYIPRQNYFLGKWMRHCGWSPDFTLRLFRKSSGTFRDRAVHESVAVEGKVKHLANPFLHYTYKDLNAYIARLNRYSTLAAAQMITDKSNQKSRSKLLLDIALRPLFTFLRMYFLQLGILDGSHGLILSVHHSFYVLAKYAKLWESLRPQAMLPSSGSMVFHLPKEDSLSQEVET